MVFSVSAKVFSWRQNSLELYGYGSQDYAQYNFKLSSGATICFNDVGCFLRKEGETEADSESGCVVTKRAGAGYTDQFLMRSSEEVWFPVKHLKPVPEQILMVGMQIRFGRTRFTVQEIDLTPEVPAESPTEEASHSFESVCKICLSSSNTPKNPLLSICKCSGSLQFIHLKCAEAFVQSKMRTNDSPTVDSFHIKPVVCDLCHAELPMKHREQDTEYSLESMFKPDGPYVKVVKTSDPTEFHFLHPSVGRNAIIGRGRNSDLKLSDASVSRTHASLVFTSKGFLLKDEDSKFGTLIRAPFEFPLSFDHDVIIQVRQTVMHLRAVRPCRVLRVCCKCCLKLPAKVTPRASITDEKCVSEPPTRRNQEETPLEQRFHFG